MTETSNLIEMPGVWRDAAALADHVVDLTGPIPPADRDWLTDPIRRASRSLADQIARAWQDRRQPAVFIDHLTAAEADAAEVQTWALLATQHRLLADDATDDVDRRCEAILDALVDMVNQAETWCRPAVARRAA